jgi:hypothetical protein
MQHYTSVRPSRQRVPNRSGSSRASHSRNSSANCRLRRHSRAPRTYPPPHICAIAREIGAVRQLVNWARSSTNPGQAPAGPCCPENAMRRDAISDPYLASRAPWLSESRGRAPNPVWLNFQHKKSLKRALILRYQLSNLKRSQVVVGHAAVPIGAGRRARNVVHRLEHEGNRAICRRARRPT